MVKHKVYFNREKVLKAVVSEPSLGQEEGTCIIDTLAGAKKKLDKLKVDTSLLQAMIEDK
jgi:hypothetical protein